jgi:hypothetical protein
MFKRMTLLAAVMAALASPALAQHSGPGEWIPANPAYVNAQGTHCCGTNHCRPPEPNEVMRVPGGWMHIPTMTVLVDGTQGIYPSEEAQMFVCVWDSKFQCAFPPTAG